MQFGPPLLVKKFQGRAGSLENGVRTEQQSIDRQHMLLTTSKRQKLKVSSIDDVRCIVSKFETEYHAAQTQIQALDRILLDKNKQLSTLLTQTIEQGTDNGALCAVVEDRNTEINEMEDLFSGLAHSSEGFDLEKKQFEDRINQVSKEIQESFEECMDTKLKLKSTVQTWATLKDKSCMISEYSRQCQERISMCSEDLTGQRQTVQDVKSASEQKTEELKQIKLDAINVQSEQKQQLQLLLELKNQQDNKKLILQEHMELYRESLEMQAMQIEELQLIKHELQIKLQEQLKSSSLLKAKCDDAEAILKESKEKVSEINHNSENMRSQGMAAEQEIHKVSEIVTKMEDGISSASLLLKEYEECLESKGMEFEEARTKLVETTTGIADQAQKMSQIVRKLEEVTNDVQNMRSKHQSIEQVYKNITNELDQETRQISQEIEKYSKRIVDTEQDIAILNSNIDLKAKKLKDLQQDQQDCSDKRNQTMVDLENSSTSMESSKNLALKNVETFNENVRQNNELKNMACEEMKFFQGVLGDQHEDLKRLQANFMTNNVSLTEKDQNKVVLVFNKKAEDIKRMMNEKYSKQVESLSETLFRLKTEADVKILQQQDATHARQLQQAAKLTKAKQDLEEAEKKYHQLIELQHAKIQKELEMQQEESKKMKENFLNEKARKEAKEQEMLQKNKEELLRKEKEQQLLLENMEKRLREKEKASEQLHKELLESKQMQEEDTLSLKFHLQLERQRLDQESKTPNQLEEVQQEENDIQPENTADSPILGENITSVHGRTTESLNDTTETDSSAGIDVSLLLKKRQYNPNTTTTNNKSNTDSHTSSLSKKKYGSKPDGALTKDIISSTKIPRQNAKITKEKNASCVGQVSTTIQDEGSPLSSSILFEPHAFMKKTNFGSSNKAKRAPQRQKTVAEIPLDDNLTVDNKKNQSDGKWTSQPKYTISTPMFSGSSLDNKSTCSDPHDLNKMTAAKKKPKKANTKLTNGKKKKKKSKSNNTGDKADEDISILVHHGMNRDLVVPNRISQIKEKPNIIREEDFSIAVPTSNTAAQKVTFAGSRQQKKQQNKKRRKPTKGKELFPTQLLSTNKHGGDQLHDDENISTSCYFPNPPSNNNNEVDWFADDAFDF